MVAWLPAAGVALLAAAVLAAVPGCVRPEEAPPEPVEEGWRVLSASSAHGVLVVDIEAERPEEADEIAVEIVEPVRSRDYQEILINVFAQGRATAPAVRRIQWTPAGGYVETIYDGAP